MDTRAAQVLSFDDLMSRLGKDPTGCATNLQLAGLDPTTIGILLDHAQAPDPTDTIFEAIERRREVAGIDRWSEHEVVGPVDWSEHLNIIGGFRGSANEWINVRKRLADWWNEVEFRPEGDPELVTVRPALYVVAVSGNLQGSMEDLCTWSTTKAVTGGVKLSLGIAEFGIERTVSFSDTRTIKAANAVAAGVFLGATAEVQPTRLYVGGEPKEQAGERVTDLIPHEPISISTAAYSGAVQPRPFAALREYPAQVTPDAERPTFEHAVEASAEFSVKVPLKGADTNALSLSLKFDHTWSALHKLQIAPNQTCYLRELDGAPGTILTEEQP